MDNNNKQGRDYGLDLMRVLMTVFVVGIHVLQRGGMLGVCRDSYPRRGFVAIGLFFAVTCAVNGFALISGYVGISAKYRFSRILWLYFTVSFYNVLIPAVFRFRYGYVIDDTVKLRALFPFAYEANWYFTAYLGMFLLIPFLNAAVKHLDRRQCIAAFSALAVFFSLIPTVLYMFFDEGFDKNVFKLSSGYSALWLSVLYLVGAAVREHDLFSRVPRWSGLVCYLVTTCLGAVLTALGYYRAEIPIEPLSNYISPLVIIQALSLLIFLRGMKLPKIACKVIGFFSPHSFSIYIIHTQDAVWTIWLAGRYAERTQTTFTAMLPVMFVFYTLSLYGLCLIADMPLHYGIKLFRGAVGRLKARKTDAS